MWRTLHKRGERGETEWPQRKPQSARDWRCTVLWVRWVHLTSLVLCHLDGLPRSRFQRKLGFEKDCMGMNLNFITARRCSLDHQSWVGLEPNSQTKSKDKENFGKHTVDSDLFSLISKHTLFCGNCHWDSRFTQTRSYTTLCCPMCCQSLEPLQWTE